MTPAVPPESVITREPPVIAEIFRSSCAAGDTGPDDFPRYFHTFRVADGYTCTFNCNFTGTPFGTLYCLAVVICGRTSVFLACARAERRKRESIKAEVASDVDGDDADSTRRFFPRYYCIRETLQVTEDEKEISDADDRRPR